MKKRSKLKCVITNLQQVGKNYSRMKIPPCGEGIGSGGLGRMLQGRSTSACLELLCVMRSFAVLAHWYWIYGSIRLL